MNEYINNLPNNSQIYIGVEIKKENLQENTKILTFGKYFNKKIEKGVFTKKLTDLTFSNHFNQIIEKDVLPDSLIYLTFGAFFNQIIKKNVFKKLNLLKYLTFGEQFNKIIKKDVLPNSLTHLTLGMNFDQKIEEEVLPNSLTHLTFNIYSHFNKIIKKDVLPKNLIKLFFGQFFNQKITKNVFPDSIKHLTFGDNFEIKIEKNILPETKDTPFPIVVCDAPCTGSGTWGRTPEQLYFFKKETIQLYAERQKKIVATAIPHLASGGLFFYITCSVFKAENEEVAAFIQSQFGLEQVHLELLKGWDKQADSMFVAVFKKNN